MLIVAPNNFLGLKAEIAQVEQCILVSISEHFTIFVLDNKLLAWGNECSGKTWWTTLSY